MKVINKILDFLKRNYKFFICLIIIFLVCTYELPYVVYKPGGIVNLNERIDIENDNIKGSLSMSYVSMMRGTIPSILLSYVIDNWDIKPRSEVTIDNGSVDELIELEKLYMTSSINNATILAYTAAGAKIEVTKTYHNIIYIDDDAQTNLKVHDKLLKVNDIDFTNIDALREIISTYEVGDEVTLLVERNGKKVSKTAKVYEIEGVKKIGIATLDTFDFATDPEIKVKTKASESGSSGGLMLSLAIYNKLTKEDITKGNKIVGTGTIDVEGNVGEIDGVKYKILGAVKNKADIFLCPIENYDEALKVKKEEKLDIKIKAVKTFDEALNYLKTIDTKK